MKALGRPGRGEPQVAVGVKIHPTHGRARGPTHFGQFNARVGGVQHPDHLSVAQFQQAFLVGRKHHVVGVCGVDADVHDVLHIGDVVRAFRKGWDVPCPVAELVEAVGSEFGRPRGTDPPRGDPKVVVPAVHSAHRSIGRTQGAVGAGGDAQCRRLGGPCHDPAHGACEPNTAEGIPRPKGQILNIHKRRERIVDGHRFALGVPSPGLTARSHEQAVLSGAIRGKNPRPFRHASPWQSVLIPTGHHFPKAVIRAAPKHGGGALGDFGGHPPRVCEAFQCQHGPEIRRQRPRFPTVGIGEEGIGLGGGQDTKVRPHKPLAFKRHHAAGIHRNVGRCEAPRVCDFLFLEVEDNHPDRRRQVGLIPFDGDGLDALASHDLGNA